jgi:hypothetical protein
MKVWIVQNQTRRRVIDDGQKTYEEPIWIDKLKTVEKEWAHEYVKHASNPYGQIRIMERDSQGHENTIWERL